MKKNLRLWVAAFLICVLGAPAVWAAATFNVVSIQIAGGPTLTTGAAAPTASAPEASVYFRAAGTSTGIYQRVNGAWVQTGVVGGGTTLGGDVTGSSGANTVVRLQNRNILATAPTTSQAVIYNGSAWAPAAQSVTGVGDWTGASGANTVGKVNATSIPASPSASTLLVATNSTTASWTTLVNANVSGSAAIDGTKISPNFGSQNVLTTGVLSLGTTPANGGQVRLPNNSVISFRNAGNSANLDVVGVDSSNGATFGTPSGATAVAGTSFTVTNVANEAFSITRGTTTQAGHGAATVNRMNFTGHDIYSTNDATVYNFGPVPLDHPGKCITVGVATSVYASGMGCIPIFEVGPIL